MPVDLSPLTIGSSLGIAFGLVLLVKGMAGQRRAARIGDMGSSTISSIAVGEVRISGVVEPAELTLTSPLQSRTCVYYRAKVSESQGRSERTILDEERAVGFRVRDASGDVRVFPRDAHFLVPDAFKEGTGVMGDEPPGLHIRTGGAFQAGFVDREVQIAELLTVHTSSDAPGTDGGSLGGLSTLGFAPGGRRDYEEARIEPGDIVTIVGMALPFDQLPDPSGADSAAGGLDATGGIGDPEIAADLAAARAAGTLETDPAEAWGNAAIPGFGIGRPVRPVELDPGVTPLPLATSDEAELAERTFEIEPDTLILAAAPEAGLLVSLGTPGGSHRPRGDPVPGRIARGDPGHRLCCDPGERAERRGHLLMPFAVAAWFAVLVVIVIAGFVVVSTYNDVVALIQRIDKAWANVDVALKQRHDELPNLVAAVRDVMAFEEAVLEEVSRLRNAYDPDRSVPEQGALSAETSQAVRSLFAVVENYPVLRSADNVIKVQAEIERLEEVIADRRELYNDQVYRYNTRIAQLPAVLLASLFGWTRRDFFAAADDDRARPDVSLRTA